jgi:hypothetical protein
MAQFSMVEGINNVESTLGSLQGVGLIGKQITYTAADGTTKSGIAASIAMSGSTYTVQVGNDDVDPANILGVATAGAADTTTTPATTPNTGGNTTPAGTGTTNG